MASRGDLATLEADIAVLGVPHGVPYDMDNLRAPSATAPAAVREQSIRLATGSITTTSTSADRSSPGVTCAWSTAAT